METFRTEMKKSKELQEDIKALQDETGRLSESNAFKRAKEALEKSKEASSATGRAIKKTSEAAGHVASATWNSPPVRLSRDAASKTADVLEKASEPLRKTELYQSVKDVIDDGASVRYGGFETKEQRRARRLRDLEKRRIADLAAGRNGPVKANESAGESVVVHATAKPDTDFKATSLGRKIGDMKLAYEESENGLVSAVRTVTDKIGWFFAETESGQVARAFKQMDPNFSQDNFLQDLRNYILPEVLDAYLRGDQEVLKQWFSEASFNVWNQTTKEYREKHLYSAGRILDVRGADIVQTKMLQPAEIPVYVVSARVQETNCYKSIKTDEVVAGIPDQILMSAYVMVITRIPEEMENPETNGWKILEFVRGKSQEWT